MRFTSTSMAAVATAARASIAAANESAIRFGLPYFSSARASATTSAPARAIASGESIVFSRAGSTSAPVRWAARYSRKDVESSSMSSSACNRSSSARWWAAAAPSHPSDRKATFWSSAAAAATTVAAAEPLAGAAAPEAILLSR
jgi:hypothetical protein